jgi:hypothetical protein
LGEFELEPPYEAVRKLQFLCDQLPTHGWSLENSENLSAGM